ncbi:MAG TPA: helix-turn-helix domain-containing protein [Anaerolineales bacterium]|jgi:predicted ArsR family transcriptional regulator|nr:helix-turn-helix domain-containing protein [Anaerolineales bacterium]
MKNTRQRILDYLGAHKTVTAAELSHALHVTAANVRYHLAILLEREQIESAGERDPKGRGRPAQTYRLSQKARGENLDTLSKALLNEGLGSMEPREQEDFLKRLAQRLKGEMKVEGSLTQRLYQAVRRLNEMHYQSRWEAHAEAPHLIFEHCPYRSILAEHPELCRVDASLIEVMLDRPSEQKAKLAQDDNGGTYCMFVVGRVVR